MTTALVIILASFFSMNMGASGFAPSMAAPYGARFLDRYRALLLFTLLVLLGAVTAGGKVAHTIGKDILPQGSMDTETVLVIMGAATLSLFAANLLRVPQSTSQVTVAAVAGVGLRLGNINPSPFALMLPLWFILPFAAYLATYILGKAAYPRLRRYVLSREVMRRYRLLQLMVIASSCYVAFSIGSNNVANAAGPLVGAGMAGELASSLLIAPLFGLGGLALGSGNLETAGKEISPLGILSASLVSLVAASLLLLASALGMPASEVQIELGAIFAVGAVKRGHPAMLRNSAARKAALVWVIAPLVSLGISYLLASLFLAA